jgi:ADP-ribose pyrophosphatase YjhB (NUDIX family)
LERQLKNAGRKRPAVKSTSRNADIHLDAAQSEPFSMPPSHYLPAAQWRTIQQTVPVCCVDVLVLRFHPGKKSPAAVGLISRHTPHQGVRWCTVGGRLHRNESFPQAVQRQLHETLGTAITFDLRRIDQPLFVAQYFTTRRTIGIVDPRQHTIGLTFALPIAGDPQPQGEALSFQWFPPTKLPSARQFGFGQEKLVTTCLQRLRKLSR